MPFASEEDINVHLPADKLIVDSGMYAGIQLQAERIVRGYLSSAFTSTILATWNTPDNTPEMVRLITGELSAAFYYRQRFSEDSLRDPEFAQVKYDEAISLLQKIINGEIELIDTGDTEVTGDLSTSDFWPNNSTPGPKFTMDLFGT